MVESAKAEESEDPGFCQELDMVRPSADCSRRLFPCLQNGAGCGELGLYWTQHSLIAGTWEGGGFPFEETERFDLLPTKYTKIQNGT